WPSRPPWPRPPSCTRSRRRRSAARFGKRARSFPEQRDERRIGSTRSRPRYERRGLRPTARTRRAIQVSSCAPDEQRPGRARVRRRGAALATADPSLQEGPWMIRSLMRVFAVVSLFSLLAVPIPIRAQQVGSARLEGRVVDPQGAPVATAQIVAV